MRECCVGPVTNSDVSHNVSLWPDAESVIFANLDVGGFDDSYETNNYLGSRMITLVISK